MDKERPVVLIDGWWGSGKTTLRGLLDGHPQLAVCPIQESLPGVLAHDPRKLQWMRHREVVGLRLCLGARDGYSRIERFAREGKVAFDAARRVRVERPFHFDFHRFDKEWIEALYALHEWSVPALSECYYRHFMACWEQAPADEGAIKAYVSLDSNYPKTPPFFVRNYPRGKMLYLVRDPKGVLATRSGRLPVKGESRTAAWDDLSPVDLIARGELHRILDANERVRALENEFPDRIKLVPFERLMADTANVMDGIADFIGIEKHPSLYHFSYGGERLDGVNGVSFIGRVNDDPRELLDPLVYRIAETVEQNTGIPWSSLHRDPRVFAACMKLYFRKQTACFYNKIEIPLRARIAPDRFYL